MHVTFVFTEPEQGMGLLRLPRANLHIFQSMLYSLLPPDEAAFLHNEGYESGGQKMKLYAMSWPIAALRPTFMNKVIAFPIPVRLVVSTSLNSIADHLIAGALQKGKLRLGNNYVLCGQTDKEQQTVEGESLIARTLAPITCYEALGDKGRRYTRYFKPQEREFSTFIHSNLVRKFQALHPEREVPQGIVQFTPLGQMKERISLYGEKFSMPIKGWWGRFRLDGPRELLQVGLDCGLGARNSGGWGCITTK